MAVKNAATCGCMYVIDNLLQIVLDKRKSLCIIYKITIIYVIDIIKFPPGMPTSTMRLKMHY